MPLERWIPGDGVRLHVREWPASSSEAVGPGEGPRSGNSPELSGRDGAALLVHGLASTARIWDLVAPRLGRAGVRAIAFDQRGHGRSAKPGSGYGFDRTTEDAVAVIRGLGLGRPVAVGHSWGANVVLELAVRRPGSVGACVLIDGGFLSMRDRFDWPTARDVLAPPRIAGTSIDEFLAWMRREPGRLLEITPAIEEIFLSLMRVDRDGRIRPRLSRANHLRILHALWEQDAVGLLRRVRVPTLVLAVRSAPGTPDSAGFMTEKRRAAATVRRIGGPVRLEWIDGIHDVPLQRPDAIARRILRMARGS